MTAVSPWRMFKLGVTVLFCYGLFTAWFFIGHFTGNLALPLSRLIVVPAVVADGQWLSYHELVEISHGLRGFGGVTKNSTAYHQALQAGVSRLYVQALARELDVKVSKTEINDYKLDTEVLAPGLELAHWQENDYRKYVIGPLLLAQKTELATGSSSTYQAEALASMASFRKKLDTGMPFADVAERFSDDPSAAARGDLGIMKVGDLPDWLKPAITLPPEGVSEVLDAPGVFWTMEMIESFPSTEPENAAVHFRGIAVHKKTLAEIVDNTMQVKQPWAFVW